jgi:FkbM family methyltransferase
MPPSQADAARDFIWSAMSSGLMRGSFSQLGEDAVLAWIFESRRDGFYVDVGCHHPFRYSNTAMLHLFSNWRGINIDVDERAIAIFNQARPRDVNICAAIGGSRGRMEVTLFEDGALNSLDPVAAANPAWAHLKSEKRMVDVLPLRDILAQNVPTGQPIDFMNVDVEGLDHAVLMSNDWDVYLPEVIAVEVHGYNMATPQNSQVFSFLSSKGYELMSHLVVTSIYRRRTA